MLRTLVRSSSLSSSAVAGDYILKEFSMSSTDDLVCADRSNKVIRYSGGDLYLCRGNKFVSFESVMPSGEIITYSSRDVVIFSKSKGYLHVNCPPGEVLVGGGGVADMDADEFPHGASLSSRPYGNGWSMIVFANSGKINGSNYIVSARCWRSPFLKK